MAKKKNKLPRPHISWSQIELFERSPHEYYKKYFLDQPVYETKYMTFGKNFMEWVEGIKPAPDFATQMIVNALPKKSVIEQELYVPYGDYFIKGFLDGYEPDDSGDEIDEYKTGTKAWTQARVNAHGQVDLYALGLSLQGRKVKKTHKMYWLPTYCDDNGAIKLTGEIHEFDKTVDIEAIKKRVDAFIKGVENYSPPNKLTL